MKIKKFFKYCLFTYICSGCASTNTCNEVFVDLEKNISLESTCEILHFDNLMHISMKDNLVSSVDRMVRCDSNIYILDKIQNAVFKVNITSGKINRIIYNLGRAKNEYIEITDIAMDASNNIFVYDSESKKINIYNTEGKYLRSIKKVACGSSIAIADNNNIAINSNHLENDLIIVYSPSGKELYRVSPQEHSAKQILGDIASITSWENEFVFTTPFDFNIYQTDNSNCVSMVSLDCGGKNFDSDQLKGLDYGEFQEVLYKNAKKIMSLRYLSQYENYIFLSTDRNNQLLYDIANNTIMELSNIGWPYKILFFSPIFVNKKGQFCSIVTNSNLKNGYLPLVNKNGTKLPQLKVSLNEEDTDENTLWILMGHIK